MLNLVSKTIKTIKKNKLLSSKEIERAKLIFEQNNHVILSQGKEQMTLLIDNENEIHIEVYVIDNEKLEFKVDGNSADLDVNILVSLYFIENEFNEEELSEGKKYTREGMINRVLLERMAKAKKANYEIKLASNLYGEHTLINEKGKSFTITLRDFNKKTGYINNIDWKTNKLGTTKHILFLFNYLEDNPALTKKLSKEFPFIEIYTDPLNDYKISWYYPEEINEEEETLLKSYFGNKTYIEDNKIPSFFSFFQKARDFERIKIREEVFERIETYFEQTELANLKEKTTFNFSSINVTLYPYQKEGIEFAVFKKGVIIADEMGLGKTLQAIGTAILKKELLNFKKTLVICPASVKHQWKNEIEKFTTETSVVVEGFPEEREKIYISNDSFFHIINYETVLRDLSHINKSNYDFLILDEAQKIKNYETKTATAVKNIHKKHALVITGTPLENKLLDLYSIVQFLDQNFLSPQWEFSYQHCIFDTKYKNKIHGYYNLQNLKERLNSILVRREKQDVFEQLPNVVQKNIYVLLSEEQANLHANFARGIAKILGKKFKTTYDWQKLMHLLTNMRMVCDSSYLIDKETHHSPKLVELKEILLERLDLKNNKRKIIIFSEWVTMLGLIEEMLTKENITFTKLTGKVPVKKRGALIKEFEKNEDCQVFLSSESGGVGLNLQVADTIINFELPWNPAKKNQRIGRIDRIGQKKQKLHVFNLLSHNSIEMKIATGLLLKQNLFDGVLNSNNMTDEVDFSEKGKSQFIKQLEEVINEDDFSTNDEGADNEENILELEEEEEVLTETTENPQVISEKKQDNVYTEFEQMEEVMTKGMEFLTGMYAMSSGKKVENAAKPKINVNKETGEVSITFKMDLHNTTKLN